jgi:hypothetical protein
MRIEKLLLVAGVHPSAASSRPAAAIWRAQARKTGSAGDAVMAALRRAGWHADYGCC